MSKELEALKDLLKNPYYIELIRTQGKAQFNNDIQIIETALKALKIIKEKQVFIANLIYHLQRDDNVMEYNKKCGWENSSLTDKEYDLLREVLL